MSYQDALIVNGYGTVFAQAIPGLIVLHIPLFQRRIPGNDGAVEMYRDGRIAYQVADFLEAGHTLLAGERLIPFTADDASLNRLSQFFQIIVIPHFTRINGHLPSLRTPQRPGMCHNLPPPEPETAVSGIALLVRGAEPAKVALNIIV